MWSRTKSEDPLKTIIQACQARFIIKFPSSFGLSPGKWCWQGQLSLTVTPSWSVQFAESPALGSVDLQGSSHVRPWIAWNTIQMTIVSPLGRMVADPLPWCLVYHRERIEYILTVWVTVIQPSPVRAKSKSSNSSNRSKGKRTKVKVFLSVNE